MQTSNASISGLTPTRNRLKFLTFHLPFSLFIMKNPQFEWPWHLKYFGIEYPWWNHQMHFKMVHFNIKTQNLELVNLKCVTCTQPIPLSLIIYILIKSANSSFQWLWDTITQVNFVKLNLAHRKLLLFCGHLRPKKKKLFGCPPPLAP